MDAGTVVDIFQQGVYLAAMLVCVIVLPGLVVGLIFAMFQAATQINEMSLSFVPKVLITFLTLSVMGPWMLKMLMAYTTALIQDIPFIIHGG